MTLYVVKSSAGSHISTHGYYLNKENAVDWLVKKMKCEQITRSDGSVNYGNSPCTSGLFWIETIKTED